MCAEAVDRIALVRATLASPPRGYVRTAAPARRFAMFALAAAAAVVIALGYKDRLGLWAGRTTPTAAAPTFSVLARGGAQPAGDRVFEADGAVRLLPRAWLLLRWGEAVVRLDGGKHGAQLRLIASTTERRELALDKGRVTFEVAPLPAGTVLAVSGGERRVVVRGTRFFVERREGEPVTVAVARGRVRVEERARKLELVAGVRLAARAKDPVPLFSEDVVALEDAVLDPARATAMPEAPSPAPQPRQSHLSEEEEALLGEARREILSGQYRRATRRLARLSRTLGSSAGRMEARLLGSQALRLDGQYERSLALLGTVPITSPSAERALVMRAEIYADDLADHKRAQRVWSELLARFPSGELHREATFRLAQALMQGGRARAAIAAFEQHLAEKDPIHAAQAHHALGVLLRDHRHDCAVALGHFHAAAQGRAPVIRTALIDEARCALQTGRPAEARAAYEAYLKLDARGPWAKEARAALGSAR